MLDRIKLFSWSREGWITSFKPEALLQGVIWALTCTAFISAALSLWVVVGTGQVYHFSSIVAVGVLVGLFVGGAAAGRAAGSQGWLHGGAVGIIFGLALLLFTAAWGGGHFPLVAVMLRLLAAVILAATGGVVGVNLKKSIPWQRERFFTRMR